MEHDRYFNEASLDLNGNHWELMKSGLPKVPTLIKFVGDLARETYEGTNKPLRVGIDAFVHAASFAKQLTDEFEAVQSDLGTEEKVGDIDTLDEHPNLVDFVWGDDRPAIPTSPFRVHPMKYAGKSVQDKIEDIRGQMKEKKATLAIYSALDEIAYLFNLRAKGDVETCPVGISYATVTPDAINLYCDEAKVTSEDVQAHLKEAGVTIQPYDNIVSDIQTHLADVPKSKVWLEEGRSNYALSRIVPKKQLVNAQSAVTPMKACKNEVEMEGMRQAHIADGAAMAHSIAWLENAIVTEGRKVSEVEIDEVITGYRAEQPGFVEVSFPTIAGVGSNGAIIHYRAKEDTDLLKHLDMSNPILIDSGGQYEYGTTDVTRTWHFGEATPKFINAYTRVLKGNIGVDAMIFPENTPGFVLDVFARKALWEGGMDYGHGTGHGVGAALNVHEGPMSISPRWANTEVLKQGMVLSNEPGHYVDGEYGVRIENLLEIVYVNEEEAKKEDKPAGEKTFLKFDKLTMIPIQKNLINIDLMTPDELDWLDTYHEEVYEKVSPLLEEGSPALAWLKKACEKIQRN